MNTMEMWRQAMQPNEADILCMDDLAVYRQWVSEIDEGKCPFCGQPIVSRKAMVCPNSACLFRTVTYTVLMKFGQDAD
jgi:hypothetical protein